jgi:hypothetical protein
VREWVEGGEDDNEAGDGMGLYQLQISRQDQFGPVVQKAASLVTASWILCS